MRYLLTTDKIDLYLIFNQKADQILLVQQLKKSKGKQSFDFTAKKVSDLTKYIPYCQLIIDQILYFQKLREKALTNVDNLFVNISAKKLDSLVGKRNKLVCLSILKDIEILLINENYAYAGDSTYGKTFTKSYRIHPNYYGKTIQYTGDPLISKLSSFQGTNNTKGDPLIITQDKGYIVGSCGSPISDLISRDHYKLGLTCTDKDITISEKTNWIYSPISRLKRETRKQMTKQYDLVEIDIRSAYLQFFIAHLNTLPIENDAFKSEIKALERMIMTGSVYEQLMKSINCSDRECVKKIVMRWLASSGTKNSQVVQIRSLFPGITRYIKQVNGKGTKQLLNQLMKCEGDLIADVLKEMKMKCPDSICLPLFDAIIVDKKISNIAYDLMTDNGSKELGFNMLLKIDKI